MKLLPPRFYVRVRRQYTTTRANNGYTTQPNFLPKFQGGSYNPWGGPEGGCPDNTGPDFANLFYRHNVGQRVTAMCLYMLLEWLHGEASRHLSWVSLYWLLVDTCGSLQLGNRLTAWKATSYDYWAPISENHHIADKFYETKLLGLFLRGEPIIVTQIYHSMFWRSAYSGERLDCHQHDWQCESVSVVCLIGHFADIVSCKSTSYSTIQLSSQLNCAIRSLTQDFMSQYILTHHLHLRHLSWMLLPQLHHVTITLCLVTYRLTDNVSQLRYHASDVA